MPDASFGIYFYGDYYYAGFSIPHLIQSRMTFDSNGNIPQIITNNEYVVKSKI